MKKLFKILTSIFALELMVACSPSTSERELYVYSGACQCEFNVGEAFSHEGLVVSDYSSFADVTGYTLSISDGYIFTNSDVGEKDVVVSKRGYKAASYTITVTDHPSLIIETYPQTVFHVGDSFNYDGLVVSDGTSEVTGFEVNITTGFVFEEAGLYTVTITKDGYYRATYEINVHLANTLFVRSNPTKTYYQQGDEFSSSGLVVVDEYDAIVNDYTISINNGDILKYSGEFPVKINKKGYESAEFSISVNPNSSVIVNEKTVNIYYLNDTHGSFIRQEVSGSTNEGGMAYIGQYIMDHVNTDHSNDIETVVLSGGDMFQGGIESNTTRGKIMVDAMNIIGFDAMVLGNHEFDWGEQYIIDNAELLDCPLISSNVLYEKTQVRPTYLDPFVVLDRGDLRIGIIGGAQKDMGSSITGSISNDFSFPDPVPFITSYSTELRLTYNCDIVVAAFHDEGYDYKTESSPEKFDALTDINPTTKAKYVDAMFFAHDHYMKSGNYNNVPYLESGCNGRYVGLMTLNLKTSNFKYNLDTYSTSNTSAYKFCTTENENIANLVVKYAEEIGNPDEVIYTFKNTYDDDGFTVIACQAMYWYVNEYNSLFGGQHVYLASHNTGGVRAKVPAGNFTRRSLFKVFPFENELCIQICNEQQINRTLDYSYYATYNEDPIVYDAHGNTHAVSISYICESKYAYRYQSGYVKYPYITRDALVEFLSRNINPNL